MPKERPIIYCGTCPKSRVILPGDPLFADSRDYYNEIVGEGGPGDYPGSLKSILENLRELIRPDDLFQRELNTDQLNLLQRVKTQLKVIKEHPDWIYPVLINCHHKRGWALSIDHCPDTCKNKKSML